MKKIVMACILFASLFLCVCFGFRSNAYELLDNGNLISSNLFNKDSNEVVYGTGYAPGSSQSDWVRVGNISLLGGRTYTSNITMSRVYYRLGTTGDYTLLASDVSTFTLPSYNGYITITFSKYVGIGQSVSTAKLYFERLMLVEGTISMSYEPFGIWFSNDYLNKISNDFYENGYEAGILKYDWVEKSFNLAKTKIIFTEDSSLRNPFIQSSNLYYNDLTVSSNFLDFTSLNTFIDNHLPESDYRNAYVVIDLNIPVSSNDFLLTFTKNNSFVQQSVYVLYSDNSFDVFSFETSDTLSLNVKQDSTIISIAFRNYMSDYLITSAYIGQGALVFDQGYSVGYDKGHSTGYEEGKLTGETNGYNKGYNQGFDSGYQEGAGGNNTLVGMIYAIVDAPFHILKDSLNLNFLGTNLASFVFSFLTLIVVIKVIKMFL